MKHFVAAWGKLLGGFWFGRFPALGHWMSKFSSGPYSFLTLDTSDWKGISSHKSSVVPYYLDSRTKE